MWGGGSQYGPPGPGSEMYHQIPGQSPGPGPAYFNPMAPYAHPYGQMNPFDSPGSGSDRGSMRAPSFYPPYPAPPSNHGQQHPGMGAPGNTVMSGLAGMANPRMSSYSLATTANPLQAAIPLEPTDDPEPSDTEVLGVLRRYLAQQDLMSV
jgi:chitin synthase